METKQNLQSQAAVVVNGKDLPMSTKTAMLICHVIKNKKIEPSIKFLEAVAKEKQGIKGGKPRGQAHGLKYPVKASGVFVKLLKSLSSNATVKGLDPSMIVIHARANMASRPHRPGTRPIKFKRTHVILEGRLAPAVADSKKKEDKK